MKSISLPAGLREIGGYAFQNCEQLRSVTLGSGVKSIGECAFSSCFAVIFFSETM